MLISEPKCSSLFMICLRTGNAERRGHLHTVYILLEYSLWFLTQNLTFFKHSSPVKVLSPSPHKNSFQDIDLIFMVLFKNVCKPTMLVSEWPSLSSLHTETVSGCDEALLPMRSQPGLETEHMSGWWGLGTGHHPCQCGGSGQVWGWEGVQITDLQAPCSHLESASRGRTRN